MNLPDPSELDAGSDDSTDASLHSPLGSHSPRGPHSTHSPRGPHSPNPHALHVLSEYPVLHALARAHTEATRLDGRAIASIYSAHLAEIDERTLNDHERQLMRDVGVELEISTPAALQRRYPYMFPLEGDEGRRAYRFYRGWFPTVVDMCHRIDAYLGDDKHGFHWTRLREKYGEPSLYCLMRGSDAAMISRRNTNVEQLGSGSRLADEEGPDSLHLLAFIGEVEDKLRCVCIVCGASASITNDQGPWASLCKEHRAESFKEGHEDWRGTTVWSSAADDESGEGWMNDRPLTHVASLPTYSPFHEVRPKRVPQEQLPLRLRLERQSQEAILKSSEWLSVHQLLRLLSRRDPDEADLLHGWWLKGQVFCIDFNGWILFPAYQFDEHWRPWPVIQSILVIFASLSDWRVAGWFESTNGFLGGARPRELLALDPARVEAAARDHMVGPIHG